MSAQSLTIWPAICSAIAATFSAVAAIVLMVVHIRNRADSVRPEVILEDWSLEEEPQEWGVIQIKKIRNEGKGSALHMRGQLKAPGEKPIGSGGPFLALFLDPVPVLSPGKELDVKCHAKFQWNGSIDSMLPLHLTLFIADLHGRLHEMTYELVATKGEGIVGGVTNLAPGLDLTRRHTTVTTGWRLRLRSKRRRIADAVSGLRKRIEQNKLFQKSTHNAQEKPGEKLD